MARSKRPGGEDGRFRPTLESLLVFVGLAGKLKARADDGASFASLSEAANALSSQYSKSNVFRALGELEDHYGRQLVNRARLTLTVAGEAVYQWASALTALHGVGKSFPLGGRERIHIGTSNWILNFLLPGAVRKFSVKLANRKPGRTDPPAVDLAFSEYDVERLLTALRRGEVQAGVAAVLSDSPRPGIDLEPIRKNVGVVMVAAQKHERGESAAWNARGGVTLDDVAGEAVCVLEADLGTVLTKLPPPAGSGRRILVENYASVAALVRAGACVGFLPELSPDGGYHPAYEGLKVYRVSGEIPTRTLAILRRVGEVLPPEVEAFLKAVSKTLRSETERTG